MTHEEINRLVRQYKGKLADPLKRNLQKLRLQIHKALNGEENYHVYIYISDELDDPIKFENGSGDNELVIDIEEDGIECTWTKRSWWKRTKDFFRDAANEIIDGLRSLWGGIRALGGSALKAIAWIV